MDSTYAWENGVGTPATVCSMVNDKPIKNTITMLKPTDDKTCHTMLGLFCFRRLNNKNPGRNNRNGTEINCLTRGIEKLRSSSNDNEIIIISRQKMEMSGARFFLIEPDIYSHLIVTAMDNGLYENEHFD